MLYPPQITANPNADLGLIIVIPCYNESMLEASLEALRLAELPTCAVEIIVMINNASNAVEWVKNTNRKTYKSAQTWAAQHSTTRKQFHILYQSDLPPKKAGVGLARKIGMDEAAFRLEAVDRADGIIVGFDADSLCEANYFTAIEAHFKKYPKIQAASIHYEHPLTGTTHEPLVYQAITEYEMHLRYFTLAKRFANHPHAFETIGSSMAVRANAYQQQGGMNTRKAGEDFYFLNKFIVLGKLNELHETKVIPSPRISDRVPFGTGKAVSDLLESGEGLETYSFQTFIDLKKMLEQIPSFYEQTDLDWKGLPFSIAKFFVAIDAAKRIAEIQQNTSDFQTFEKRFFRWFDPFMIMKYAHYARDHFYKNIPVTAAGQWILENYLNCPATARSAKEILLELRKAFTN